MLTRAFGKWPLRAKPFTDRTAKFASRLPGTPASLLLPYFYSVCLFAAASAVMYVGDANLVHYGFPWSLVYLLIVAAVASLWGARPAALALALSALFGDLIVPDLHISYFYGHDPSWRVRLLRMVLFAACGAALVWLTERARHMQERSEQRRTVVESLQRMILPERLTDVPGYDLSGFYLPAHLEEAVGGDFYDFFPTGTGTYGLLIGDVMGKGKEAAASTALLRYSVRAFTSMGLGPAAVLSQLNVLIESQKLSFSTATLFLGILDPASGCLRYANAGHELPMLRRCAGQEETLVSTGLILGVGLDLPYEEEVIWLEAGDALLLMTDGATEARSESGTFLDSAGVWRLLRAALSLPTAETATAALSAALERFIGRASRDDIALLLLRRTGSVSVSKTSGVCLCKWQV